MDSKYMIVNEMNLLRICDKLLYSTFMENWLSICMIQGFINAVTTASAFSLARSSKSSSSLFFFQNFCGKKNLPDLK